MLALLRDARWDVATPIDVPIAGVEKAVQRLCAQDQPVTYRRYPGLDHDPTMEQSTRFQLEWIGERFAGKPATSTCPAP